MSASIILQPSSIKFYLLRKFNKFIIIICLKLDGARAHGYTQHTHAAHVTP